MTTRIGNPILWPRVGETLLDGPRSTDAPEAATIAVIVTCWPKQPDGSADRVGGQVRWDA